MGTLPTPPRSWDGDLSALRLASGEMAFARLRLTLRPVRAGLVLLVWSEALLLDRLCRETEGA